ncbi:hypothetical protein GCM10011374_36360 [Kocuria dechangensis]|uniref:Uncharacterized protein n=1 Tax=Kocuria dechangensis TaxID=1176249 RepID=A0A917H5J2_9MICC|nr:hypothetical protein [Kocuria dechangensis]GGG68682.1 hypothetical protein GCM10011374_36360 [Kocuria dechangensis]
MRANPELEHAYDHTLNGLRRAAANPAGTGSVSSRVLESDPARIEAAVAAGYAQAQQLYQVDEDTTGARETRRYGRAIALSQVYSRG